MLPVLDRERSDRCYIRTYCRNLEETHNFLALHGDDERKRNRHEHENSLFIDFLMNIIKKIKTTNMAKCNV